MCTQMETGLSLKAAVPNVYNIWDIRFGGRLGGRHAAQLTTVTRGRM